MIVYGDSITSEVPLLLYKSTRGFIQLFGEKGLWIRRYFLTTTFTAFESEWAQHLGESTNQAGRNQKTYIQNLPGLLASMERIQTIKVSKLGLYANNNPYRKISFPKVIREPFPVDIHFFVVHSCNLLKLFCK